MAVVRHIQTNTEALIIFNSPQSPRTLRATTSNNLLPVLISPVTPPSYPILALHKQSRQLEPSQMPNNEDGSNSAYLALWCLTAVETTPPVPAP